MSKILLTWFATVLQMSLTGSFVCLAVCLLRLILKRAPKIFAYGLWALVFLRFACPVAFHSPASVLPRWDLLWEAAAGTAGGRGSETLPAGRPDYLGAEVWQREDKRAEEGSGQSLGAVSPVAAEGAEPSGNYDGITGREGASAAPTGANGAEETAPIGLLLAAVWLGGTAALLLWQLIRSVRFRSGLGAVRVDEAGICEVPGLRTPFVAGIFCPRIYLPQGLSGEERDFILLHESVHIRRRDTLIKPLCFAVACVHWFNPFAWLSWRLMCIDMELSCDETVLGRLPANRKRAYAQALLSFADSDAAAVCPGFGEPYARKRIRNVLNYRRPAYRLSLVLTAFCLLVSGCLLTDPADGDEADGAESIRRESQMGAAPKKQAASEPELWQTPEVLTAYLMEPDSRALLEMGVAEGDRRSMHFEELGERKHLLQLARLLAETVAPEELLEEERTALLQAGLEGGGPVLRISAAALRQAYEKTGAPAFREEWLSDYFGGWYEYDGSFYLEESSWLQEAAAPVSCTRAYVDVNGLLHIYYAYETPDSSEKTGMTGEAILVKEDGRWLFLTNDVIWEQTEQARDLEEEEAYRREQEAWWASYEVGSASPVITERSESWEADVTHDGRKERIVFDWGYFDRASWGIFAVLDPDGRVIYKEEPGSAHPGWMSLYLCRLDGEEYLFRYTPTCYQGWCDYSYELFSLGAEGEKIIRDSGLVSFYSSEGDSEWEAPALELPAMVDFAETVNTYMENAFLLVSTDPDAIGSWPEEAPSDLFITSTAEQPVRLWETYSFIREENERNYAEKPELSGLLKQLKAWCESRKLPFTE